MSEIHLSEIPLSEIQFSKTDMSEIKMSKMQMSEIQLSEMQMTERNHFFLNKCKPKYHSYSVSCILDCTNTILLFKFIKVYINFND